MTSQTSTSSQLQQRTEDDNPTFIFSRSRQQRRQLNWIERVGSSDCLQTTFLETAPRDSDNVVGEETPTTLASYILFTIRPLHQLDILTLELQDISVDTPLQVYYMVGQGDNTEEIQELGLLLTNTMALMAPNTRTKEPHRVIVPAKEFPTIQLQANFDYTFLVLFSEEMEFPLTNSGEYGDSSDNKDLKITSSKTGVLFQGAIHYRIRQPCPELTTQTDLEWQMALSSSNLPENWNSMIQDTVSSLMVLDPIWIRYQNYHYLELTSVTSIPLKTSCPMNMTECKVTSTTMTLEYLESTLSKGQLLVDAYTLQSPLIESLMAQTEFETIQILNDPLLEQEFLIHLQGNTTTTSTTMNPIQKRYLEQVTSDFLLQQMNPVYTVILLEEILSGLVNNQRSLLRSGGETRRQLQPPSDTPTTTVVTKVYGFGALQELWQSTILESFQTHSDQYLDSIQKTQLQPNPIHSHTNKNNEDFASFFQDITAVWVEIKPESYGVQNIDNLGNEKTNHENYELYEYLCMGGMGISFLWLVLRIYLDCCGGKQYMKSKFGDMGETSEEEILPAATISQSKNMMDGSGRAAPSSMRSVNMEGSVVPLEPTSSRQKQQRRQSWHGLPPTGIKRRPSFENELKQHLAKEHKQPEKKKKIKKKKQRSKSLTNSVRSLEEENMNIIYSPRSGRQYTTMDIQTLKKRAALLKADIKAKKSPKKKKRATILVNIPLVDFEVDDNDILSSDESSFSGMDGVVANPAVAPMIVAGEAKKKRSNSLPQISIAKMNSDNESDICSSESSIEDSITNKTKISKDAEKKKVADKKMKNHPQNNLAYAQTQARDSYGIGITLKEVLSAADEAERQIAKLEAGSSKKKKRSNSLPDIRTAHIKYDGLSESSSAEGSSDDEVKNELKLLDAADKMQRKLAQKALAVAARNVGRGTKKKQANSLPKLDTSKNYFHVDNCSSSKEKTNLEGEKKASQKSPKKPNKRKPPTRKKSASSLAELGAKKLKAIQKDLGTSPDNDQTLNMYKDVCSFLDNLDEANETGKSISTKGGKQRSNSLDRILPLEKGAHSPGTRMISKKEEIKRLQTRVAELKANRALGSKEKPRRNKLDRSSLAASLSRMPLPREENERVAENKFKEVLEAADEAERQIAGLESFGGTKKKRANSLPEIYITSKDFDAESDISSLEDYDEKSSTICSEGDD